MIPSVLIFIKKCLGILSEYGIFVIYRMTESFVDMYFCLFVLPERRHPILTMLKNETENTVMFFILLILRSRKTVLPPCLVNKNGNAVGEIHAPAAGNHGNTHLLFRRQC